MPSRVLSVLAAAMALLVLLGVQACDVTEPFTSADTDSRIVTDEAVVDAWTASVTPGLADLNSVGPLSGLQEEAPAQVSPCVVDSGGGLFQPSAGRRWSALHPGRGPGALESSVTASTARGYQVLLRRLGKSGWTITGRDDLLGFVLPAGPDFDTTYLERRAEGTELHLSLQVFHDGVSANLWSPGAEHACRLAS